MGQVLRFNPRRAMPRKAPPAVSDTVPPGDESGPPRHTEVAERLIKLRRFMGWRPVEAARQVGVTKQLWNHWERGHGRPSVDDALALADLTGATLDFIYTGRRYGISAELKDYLLSQERDGGLAQGNPFAA